MLPPIGQECCLQLDENDAADRAMICCRQTGENGAADQARMMSLIGRYLSASDIRRLRTIFAQKMNEKI